MSSAVKAFKNPLRILSARAPTLGAVNIAAFSTSVCQRNQVSYYAPPPSDNFVRVVEVGPRDGLQDSPGRIVPTPVKLELIDRLLKCGTKVMEVGSLVRPDRVPQMADTSKLLPILRDQQTSRGPDVNFQVLVPNMRGLDNLLKLEHENRADRRLAEEIAFFVPASDEFCKANNGTTVDKLLDSLPAVAKKALDNGYKVRGYVSVAITDPFTGPVDTAASTKVARHLDDMGCYEISLGDTTGEGTPVTWIRLWEALVKDGLDMTKMACHTHNTFSTAIASIAALLPLGLRIVDSSVAGLGGCPYSPGATGNVATEDVVHLLHSLGYETGIDLMKMAETGEWISNQLGRSNESNVGRALLARQRLRQKNAERGI